MSEHGKEPWRIECLKDDGDCEFMRSADGIDSIPVYWLGNDDRTASANARRIVACVNALAGIPTDVLEHSVFRNVLDKVGAEIMKFNATHTITKRQSQP
jgi:hypothetical protein